MRKILLVLLVSSILFSCSKNTSVVEPTSQTEAAKQPFSLNVTGFIQSHENLREENPVKISDLYCVIYSSDNVMLKYIHQDTLTQKETFGTVQDSLAPGVYTIVMFVSELPLYVTIPSNNNDLNAHTLAPPLLGMGILPFGQIFFKKFQMEVKPDSNPSSINVDLDRIVGKLQVELVDAQKENTTYGSISLAVHPLAPFFSFGLSKALPPDDIWQYWGTRTSQTKFEDYLIGSDHEFTVTLYYQDKNTGETLTKTIEHVKCTANQKTIIRGYLYGDPQNPGGPGLKVNLNQEWSSDSTVIHI